jgi:hypothetical protein
MMVREGGTNGVAILGATRGSWGSLTGDVDTSEEVVEEQDANSLSVSESSARLY